MKFINRSIFILFTLITQHVFAQQTYTGYSQDNYNGYTGSYLQPASIANTLSKFSVSSSFASIGSNNFIGANGSLLSRSFNNEETKYRQHKGPGYQMQHLSADVLGLYFEINHKNSLGYSFRIREFSNIDGLPESWTKAIHSDYDSTKLLNTPISFDEYGLQQFVYNEHRFNYARVVIDNQPHFIKAGGAFKLINGIDAMYLYADKGSFEFVNQDNGDANFDGTEFQYGRAEKDEMFSSRKLGVGFDLGAVYEYRRDTDRYLYDMDGEKDIERYDRNKYLFKIGVSITDIGRVKYSKDSASYNFIAPDSVIDANDLSAFNLEVQNILNGDILKEFDQLASSGTEAQQQEETFNMNLPTAFNLQLDYHIWKRFYANYTTSIPLKRKTDPHKSHLKAIHSITPRYEHRIYGIMLPITIQRNGQVNLGIAGRYMLGGGNLGVFGGANNITNFVGKRAKFTSHFFAGLIFNLGYKTPKDEDGDKVSDKFDDCKYDVGLYKYNGCPDTDGDGIVDKEDYCIYKSGPIELNGCPDKDNDGVIDLNDMCPNDSGLYVHYGCPDSDRDGVIDVADLCPNIPGIEFNNGCPFENPGCCTDNDGDGVTNNVDSCPEISGSIYLKGCPIDSSNFYNINFDSLKALIDPNNTITKIDFITGAQSIAVGGDGAGVFTRKEIEKGKEKGSTSSKIPKGELQTEEIKIDPKNILETFDIYFNYDEISIKEKYDKKIKSLIKEYKLDKYGKGRVHIIGHTDNDGKDQYNLQLSKRRAEIVKRKLIDGGMNILAIKTFFYGERRPLRTNENDRGKSFNRRVELIIVKE